MTDAGGPGRAQTLDLPSLLATTAARQALTPTARMQALLTAQGTPHRTQPTPIGVETTPLDAAQSFNDPIRAILDHRDPRKIIR